MARTSSSESSRARVTRLHAELCASRTPSALVMLICVLAWISRSGAMARQLSDADVLHDDGVGAGFGDRGQRARRFLQFVLEDERVESDVAFTPRRCSVRITSGNSPSEKPTLARAVKCLSPK